MPETPYLCPVDSYNGSSALPRSLDKPCLASWRGCMSHIHLRWELWAVAEWAVRLPVRLPVPLNRWPRAYRMWRELTYVLCTFPYPGEFVRRGCTVVLYDHTEYTRTRAFQTLRASLWDHVANGYLLKQDVEDIMLRITTAGTLEDTLERSELLIESVFEDAALKRDLFNQMCDILKARAIPPDQITLCSNTMALPMLSIIEDIQAKEYRGSCIGMRFLHPVWFIDDVEITDCDYTRRSTCNSVETLLKQLFFQPFFYDGCYRRKLTLQEITTYQSRQRLRCPEPITTLPKRSIRKKFAAPGSPGAAFCDRTPPVSPEIPAGAQPEQSPSAEDTEPCAVCLEEPRSALLVPCGHMAMCVDCAEKVLHGPRPICVVCREPIEKILRASPPP